MSEPSGKRVHFEDGKSIAVLEHPDGGVEITFSGLPNLPDAELIPLVLSLGTTPDGKRDAVMRVSREAALALHALLGAVEPVKSHPPVGRRELLAWALRNRTLPRPPECG